MVIIDYYTNLSRKEKTEFINQVREVTGMGHSTFFSKLNSDGFKKLEREAIEKLIQERMSHD